MNYSAKILFFCDILQQFCFFFLQIYYIVDYQYITKSLLLMLFKVYLKTQIEDCFQVFRYFLKKLAYHRIFCTFAVSQKNLVKGR